MSDLDRGRTREEVGRLSEQDGTVDFSLGRDHFRFSDSSRLSSGRKGVLNVLRDDDILDENRLAGYSPFLSRLFNNLFDLGSYGFAFREETLQVAVSAHITENCLRFLDERRTYVLNGKGGAVRVDDVVDDDGFDLTVETIAGEDCLLRDVYDLDLDGDLTQRFAERVDFDKSRIDGTRKLSERRNESDATLLDLLVRIGATEATRDRSERSCEGPQAIDHGTVAPMVDIGASDFLSIRGLHVCLAKGLYVHGSIAIDFGRLRINRDRTMLDFMLEITRLSLFARCRVTVLLVERGGHAIVCCLVERSEKYRGSGC